MMLGATVDVGHVPIWKALAGLAWDVGRFGLIGALIAGALFSAGLLLFDRQPFYFDAVAAIYMLVGVVCGWSAGGVYAGRRRCETVVRSLYVLVEPILDSVIRAAGAEALTAVSDAAAAVAADRPPSLLARVARWQFVRSLQRHPFGELLADVAAPEVDPATPAHRAVAERLIRFTIADVQARLRLSFRLICAGVALCWTAPIWAGWVLGGR